MKMTNMLPALVLITAMFALAGWSGQREIIFPEIAALALGAWIMEKPPWSGSPMQFWLSPTLAALSGMLMVRYLSYAPLPMITAAFCLVVLQLKLLRSGILPSISAAILAIITRCDSWDYPLSVCVLTGIIALGRFALPRPPPHSTAARGPGAPPPDGEPPESAEAGNGLAWWGKLLAGVMLVSAVATVSGHLFIVAPPLMVAFVELSKPGGTLRDRWARVLGLLAFAAFSGVFWVALTQTVLQWPLWTGALPATLTVFLAYHALRLPFPPAVAIALLPTIVPRESLWSYPWQVLAGSAAFILVSRLLFAPERRLAAVEGAPAE